MSIDRFFLLNFYINQKKMHKTFFLYHLIIVCFTKNYIQNGDFEQPQIAIGGARTYTHISGWNGIIELQGKRLFPQLQRTSQYLDMQTNRNGYIIQNVSLPQSGIYTLSISYQAPNNNLKSYHVEVLWGNKVVLDIQPTDNLPGIRSVSFYAKQGTKRLKIREVGYQNGMGLFIDDVELKQSKMQNNYFNSSSATNTAAVLTAIPASNINGLKYLGLFMDDIYMYFYQKRFFNQTMEKILLITNKVEQIQESYMKKIYGSKISSSILPISDLIQYSNTKHVEIDGVDDSFARSLFPFVVFRLPFIIVLHFIFYLLFRLLFNFKVSIYVRRFSFVLPCLLQGILQGNISSFTYLFFRQSFLAFSFKFADKISIAIAVLCFFVVFLIACSFFFLFNYLLQKKFGYFIYCYYRTFPSMVFLTLLMLRQITKGAIHSCLHGHYKVQIVLLCVMESLIIIAAVVLENKCGIFLRKTMFTLTVCYHFMLIFLNLTLLAEQQAKNIEKNVQIRELLLDLQTYAIVTIIGIILGQAIFDLLPDSWVKRANDKTPKPAIDQSEEEKTKNKAQEQNKLDVKDQNICENKVKEQYQQKNLTLFCYEEEESVKQQGLRINFEFKEAQSRPKEKNAKDKTIKRQQVKYFDESDKKDRTQQAIERKQQKKTQKRQLAKKDGTDKEQKNNKRKTNRLNY